MRGRGFLNLYIFLILLASSSPDRNGNGVESPFEATRSTEDTDGGTTELGPVSLPTEPVTAVSVFVQNKDTSTLLGETQEASIVPLSTPVANIMVKTSSTPKTTLQEGSPKSNGEDPVAGISTYEYKDPRADSEEGALFTTVTTTSESVREIPNKEQDDFKATKGLTPLGSELTTEGHDFLGDDPMLAISSKTSMVPSSSPMPLTTVSAAGTVRFEPRDHEARIYGAAPSGVLVTRVVAMDPRYPNTAPVYRLMGAEESLTGQRPSPVIDDSQYFQIHGLSGNITTRRYIDRPIGSTYHIVVVATSRGVSEILPLTITVTEYNSFPPRFERLNYTIQLDVLTPIGATIVTVSAKDRDPQPYNSEVYYRLHRDNNIVSINKLTGAVTLRKPLRAFFSELQITVLAQDGGSPQRTGRTKLIIIVKLISAPRDVEVMDTGYRWAMICWKAPHSGIPDGYIMVLQQNETITTRNITMQELGRDEDYFCLAVDDLKQRSNYILHIAGWNNQEVGIISTGVRLTTMVNQTCSLVNRFNNKLDYFCSCLPGYYGEKCTFFNPCNSTETPCLNGGICRSNASEMFTCECLEGYYGATCQHFNPCSRSPCQHNSTCLNITSSNYKCFCTHGYTGHLCEVNIDECESQPCQNEGVCIDALNSFSCKCASGYEGEYCELNINECISDPCQNGATCEDVTGKYLCKCPAGYEGKNCEINIDDCLSNPCENNGTCVDGIEDYFCNCQAGFEGDYCEDEVNECMARPCLHGGSCTDAFNDFSCECPAGYSGKRCEWDVDLCQSNPCQNGGECVDLVDHFKCKCPLGYQGDNCETKVKCPAETLKTERGLFGWEPVEHGAVARISCPYGMDKNYAAYRIPQFYHQSSTNGESSPALDESSLQTHTFIWWGEQKRENASELQYSQDNEQTYKSSGTFKVQTYLKNSEHERSIDFTSMKKQQKDWQSEEKKYTFDDKGNVYAIRRCVQDADGTVRWGRLFDDVCRDEGSMNAERWSQHLEHITRNPSQINIELLINISRHIQKIVTYALKDTKIAESLFTVISNIMDVNESVLYEGDKDGIIAQSIVQAVEDYAHTVKLEEMSKLVIASENLALAVLKINSNEHEIAEGLSFSPSEIQNAETSQLSEDGNMQHVFRETQNIYINIPAEALLKATKYTRTLRVKFISYKNGKLFMPNSNRSRTFQGPQMVSTQQHVITAAISNITIENLTDTIVYQLPNLHGQAKQICAFWDSENREWSEYGIITNQTTEWILCESTHMTSFSVLLDPTLTWETSEIPYKHKVILSIVSYVGSICSIIGLLLTIITYSLFRCLSRDRSGKILLNLCVSLLLMNIAFILMSMKEVFSKDTTKATEICTALAIVTHYLVLSSLTWMLVEAMHMYQLLITVFATGETRFMCKRMLLAWGIPLLIVAGTSIYDIQYYTSPSPECTVSPSQTVLYYVTYIAPSSFILIINFIVFILVTRVLFQQRGHSHGMGTYGVRTENSITLSQVRGAFTVMTLLGVTWVFGALALGEAKLVLQYLFCLTNSLQGFIIFIVRCVQYPDAWNAWTTLLLTGQLKKHRGAHGTTGLPSSSSGNTFSRPTFSSHTLPQDVSKVI